MANLSKYVVEWNGLTALPGMSVFYSAEADDATASIKAFFEAIKAWFPTPLEWSIPSSGDVIDDATGTLVGGWAGTGGGTVAASTSNTYAAGTGGYVVWGTGTIVNGRRLKGRTFLAPTTTSAYDGSGTMHSSFLSVVGGAAATLVATNDLRVWHRPPPGSPSGGSSAPVNNYGTRDQVTSLRSRRY